MCLIDRAWDDTSRVSTERFIVFFSGSDRFETYVCTTQAYTDTEYDDLLASAGFTSIRRRISPADVQADAGGGLVIITAMVPVP